MQHASDWLLAPPIPALALALALALACNRMSSGRQSSFVWACLSFRNLSRAHRLAAMERSAVLKWMCLVTTPFVVTTARHLGSGTTTSGTFLVTRLELRASQ